MPDKMDFISDHKKSKRKPMRTIGQHSRQSQHKKWIFAPVENNEWFYFLSNFVKIEWNGPFGKQSCQQEKGNEFQWRMLHRHANEWSIAIGVIYTRVKLNSIFIFILATKRLWTIYFMQAANRFVLLWVKLQHGLCVCCNCSTEHVIKYAYLLTLCQIIDSICGRVGWCYRC